MVKTIKSKEWTNCFYVNFDELVKSKNLDGKEKSSSSRRANHEEYRVAQRSGSRRREQSAYSAVTRGEAQHRNWTFYEAINFDTGEKNSMPAKWILLLLEDGMFNHESTCYAIKLAKRIGCSVSVLMLMDNIGRKSATFTGDPGILQQTLDIITAEGLQARGNFGYGDKASEFLKHLALNPSIAAIVWGGREGIITGQKKKKEDHWFTKVKSTIRCPVVRPAIKDKFKKQLKVKLSGVE